jgi:psp operon transcriptional activator
MDTLRSRPSATPREDNLIGESPAFLSCLEHVSYAAPLTKPVLVVGERGTGKELITSRLHYLSRRWDQPFLKMNCAAINENILESELFGHEAGSFTGAQKKHQGRFEKADGGTLFLDELATSSARIQEKLLRVIEYGEFERVGGSETIKVDVRLVAATNQDLPALAARGEFRADLLDRLAFDVITLPPLRYRQEDILILSEHFALRMTQELDRDLFPGFSSNAKQQLTEHNWPGNIRELKNVIERNIYLTEPNKVISEIKFNPFASPFRPVNKKPLPLEQPTTHSDSPQSNPKLPLDFKMHIQEYEISLIKNALELSQFNQKKTADILGMTYHQLRGYLKKYDLL